MMLGRTDGKTAEPSAVLQAEQAIEKGGAARGRLPIRVKD
jgi:hypothetical protein